jgi:hypothetical protein
VSVPASEVGTVGVASSSSAVTTPTTTASAQPTSAATPATGTSNPPSWLSSLISGAVTSAFSGSSFLPNAGLVIVGVILVVGALMTSQKQTTIDVVSKAGEALVG